MIDIQLLRKDPEAVARRLAARGPGVFDAAHFQRLEARRKGIQTLVEQAQAARNRLAKEIGQAKAKGQDAKDLMAQGEQLKTSLEDSEKMLGGVQQELQDFLSRVPNIPHESVPLGGSPEENREERQWGKRRDFTFSAKDHVDIGEALGGLDFATGAKIAGSRFAVMRGGMARLHRAIAQFMLDVHTRDHGYTEVYVPYLVNANAMFGTGQLPKFEADLFKVPFGLEEPTPTEEAHLAKVGVDSIEIKQKYFYLIPTAEVPVTNFVRNEIVPLEQLPQKFVCHTPCFRSEAGSAGKDTRGMIRNHQFDKVELVQIVHPDKSYDTLEVLTAHAEAILHKLELPYRVVTLCTGDMGAAAAKTYDIEVWLPAQKVYREISSCSNFEAYQARRMKARFRNEKDKREFVHTLNGSGLAVGRTLVAILENCQNADGSVTIPSALRSYMDGAEKLTRP